MVNTSQRVTYSECQRVAVEALTRLNACGALNVSNNLSQEEYEAYTAELAQLIIDSVALTLNGDARFE